LEAKITAAIATPTPTSPSAKPQLTDSKRKMDKNPTEKIRKSELIFLRHKLNRFKTNAHRTWPINLARKKQNNSTTDDPGTIFQCRQTFFKFLVTSPEKIHRTKKERRRKTNALVLCVCVWLCAVSVWRACVCVYCICTVCLALYYSYILLPLLLSKNPSLHYNIPVCVWTRLRGEEDRGTLVAICLSLVAIHHSGYILTWFLFHVVITSTYIYNNN
jgi:hypothetical protein